MRRKHYKPVRRTKLVGFCMTPDEYAIIMAAADSVPMLRSEWLRNAVLQHAKAQKESENEGN